MHTGRVGSALSFSDATSIHATKSNLIVYGLSTNSKINIFYTVHGTTVHPGSRVRGCRTERRMIEIAMCSSKEKTTAQVHIRL